MESLNVGIPSIIIPAIDGREENYYGLMAVINGMPLLKELMIGGHMVPSEAMRALVTRLANLRSLIISSCSFMKMQLDWQFWTA